MEQTLIWKDKMVMKLPRETYDDELDSQNTQNDENITRDEKIQNKIPKTLEIPHCKKHR